MKSRLYFHEIQSAKPLLIQTRTNDYHLIECTGPSLNVIDMSDVRDEQTVNIITKQGESAFMLLILVDAQTQERTQFITQNPFYSSLQIRQPVALLQNQFQNVHKVFEILMSNIQRPFISFDDSDTLHYSDFIAHSSSTFIDYVQAPLSQLVLTQSDLQAEFLAQFSSADTQIQKYSEEENALTIKNFLLVLKQNKSSQAVHFNDKILMKFQPEFIIQMQSAETEHKISFKGAKIITINSPIEKKKAIKEEIGYLQFNLKQKFVKLDQFNTVMTVNGVKVDNEINKLTQNQNETDKELFQLFLKSIVTRRIGFINEDKIIAQGKIYKIREVQNDIHVLVKTEYKGDFQGIVLRKGDEW
ncbi:Hypothetical_protein [Hexamita inflata]|uniref:Hypothetical_protein n=1 Tax=Hexamita inflata TaxID=28002 RepID=A0AA86PJR1_9EUKA|nr:Hypothetical protein HINF_LOCUS28715 [Hexamita inflata]